MKNCLEIIKDMAVMIIKYRQYMEGAYDGIKTPAQIRNTFFKSYIFAINYQPASYTVYEKGFYKLQFADYIFHVYPLKQTPPIKRDNAEISGYVSFFNCSIETENSSGEKGYVLDDKSKKIIQTLISLFYCIEK
jgi:hypothetical protein